MNLAPPWLERTLVIAAVKVVFPWSTWPSGITIQRKGIYDPVGNGRTNGANVHMRFVTRELLSISSFRDYGGIQQVFFFNERVAHTCVTCGQQSYWVESRLTRIGGKE